MEKTANQDFFSMDRRTFLKVVGAIGASTFLGLHRTQITKALELSKTKVIWLHGAECTGCSASLLDAGNPDIMQAINKLSVDLVFHETIMAHQGIFVDGAPAGTSELNSEILLDEAIEEGNYILVVEGAIANGPDGSGKYCMYGERTFKDMFEHAASNATMIMAVGMCAAFGGINSADSDIADLTDFRGVDFVKESHSKGMLTELGIDNSTLMTLIQFLTNTSVQQYSSLKQTQCTTTVHAGAIMTEAFWMTTSQEKDVFLRSVVKDHTQDQTVDSVSGTTVSACVHRQVHHVSDAQNLVSLTVHHHSMRWEKISHSWAV
ncbi:MAG: methanophenazine hydrogenase [Methanolobus sp.]|nr:methanophenazine hydrogenase [Methanolobus sp.]